LEDDFFWVAPSQTGHGGDEEQEEDEEEDLGPNGSRLCLKDPPQRGRTSKRASIFPCLQHGQALRLVPQRDTAAVH